MEAKTKRRFSWLLILLLVLLGVSLFALSTDTYVVQGSSMEPTLRDGQTVRGTSAYWLFGPPRAGDIVVLWQDDSVMIKRIRYEAGETVPWSDGLITNRPGDLTIVPVGCVWVLGDNSLESQDSRMFGPVKVSAIMGKVLDVD